MKNIKVGSKVRIVKSTSGSINPIGSIGIVSEDRYGDGRGFRVIVKDISEDNLGNSSIASDLALYIPFKVGSKVKIIKNTSWSKNPVGSIGIISELDECNSRCRVIVKGISDGNFANNTKLDDIELYEPTKEEKIEKLLKRISKLNKE